MKRSCPSCGRENDVASSFCAFCGSTLSEAYSDLTELLPQEEEAGYSNARLPLSSEPLDPLDERQYKPLTPLSSSPGAVASLYPLPPSPLVPSALSVPPAFDPYRQGVNMLASGPYALADVDSASAALQNQPRHRGWGDGLIGTLLYLWGACSALIGVAGLLLQTPEAVLGIFLIGTCVCELIALPLLLALHRYPRLRLKKRLLAQGLTLLGGIGLLVIASIVANLYQPLTDFAMGLAFLLYGVVTMVLAFW
ncbi:zinc ribbon domain-containing protein [Thermogemmatispora sp.]|uniref:zinc ribbon domain-containing protein n=1 Tax=Thermogemmatispora sp. TaxID=1968838 RepID=UPI002ACC0210|nr:zinc ribbon domain-containing protein [Thermogemmatispora sp.]